jgi:hypothetical protein
MKSENIAPVGLHIQQVPNFPSILTTYIRDNILYVRQCLLLPSQHDPGIDTPSVCVHHMFRPIAAIIRYTEPLQSPFLLSDIVPYTGQCLHTGCILYRYVVYVVPLYYKIY